MLIKIIRKTLTDGSFVYDLSVNGTPEICAYTEEDARVLAVKILCAVEKHSPLKPRISYNY